MSKVAVQPILQFLDHNHERRNSNVLRKIAPRHYARDFHALHQGRICRACYWTPTFLLGICRAWRDFALASPSLWTRIGVDLNLKRIRLNGFHRGKWLGAELERYLDRRVSLALGRPLSITFHRGFEHCLGFDRYAALVRRLAPQLQALKLDVEVEVRRLERRRPSFPLLQNLTIGLKESERDSASALIAVFAGAPLLQKVHLKRMSRDR
ncbi:hypothetical protein C8R43DRAFT_274578 [Mycena crocata]|nr:hypothetical protein C8R43DRAFT_274578 [Mycena crocata]